MMTDKAQLTDKELTAIIISRLLNLPDELRQMEAVQAKFNAELSQWKKAEKEGEIEAEINAPGGTNDDTRKKAKLAAIAASPAVKQARAKIGELEAAISASQVDTDALRRQWQASIALAELQAARLNMSAKIQVASQIK